jgi:hypothetical protein|tara:strand:- start:311 stop:670 length:360 start_codon:yes stop_codon:yes gene_type:complete
MAKSKTKNYKVFKDLKYLKIITTKKLISGVGLENYELKYEPFCDRVLSPFLEREDYAELEELVSSGLIRALDLWDGKRDLDKLVADCIMYNLFEYAFDSESDKLKIPYGKIARVGMMKP